MYMKLYFDDTKESFLKFKIYFFNLTLLKEQAILKIHVAVDNYCHSLHVNFIIFRNN